MKIRRSEALQKKKEEPQEQRTPISRNTQSISTSTSPPSSPSPNSMSTAPSASSSDQFLEDEVRTRKHVRNVARTTNLNLKEGFLMKQGAKIKSWKNRWFVIKPDGYYYFENPTEWKPLGFIPISEVSGISAVRKEELPLLKRPSSIQYFYFFKIITSRREYICAATSSEEMNEWISLGNQALELGKNIAKMNN